MLREAEEGVESGDSNNGAEAGREGPGNKDLGVLWKLVRPEEDRCKDACTEADERIMGEDFVSLGDVAVDGGGVTTNDDCGNDQYETGVWEKEGSVSEKEV